MKKKLFMKVDRGTTKIEKQVNRMVKRVAFVSIMVGVVGAIHLSNASLAWLQSKEIRPMYVISAKNMSITLQIPLRDRTEQDKKFKSPIPQVQAQETIEKAIPTPKVSGEEAVIKAQKYGEVLWRIYQLETQRGLTDWCRLNNQGFGGFGVKDGNNIVCYPTFEKAVERANYWFGEIQNGRTLHGALCKWSGYGDAVDCLYARSYEFVK